MTSKEVLEKYIQFYKEREHEQVPNVSLIPENDPTLLYVNSGMFPLVPYLMGEPHPLGTRLVNIQRCIRFDDDIDEIGKTIRHTSVFHQLGNWSLGDYFKKDQLHWLYEFLVEELKLDANRLYASVFVGDKDAPRDEDSVQILKNIFAKYNIDAKMGERIFEYDKSENWWQRGDTIGELGGPDSEIFYFIGENASGKNPVDNEDEFIEIGNSVFLQYKKTETGWQELPQKNVDYGGGFERLVMFVQGKNDIFEIDTYWPVVQKIQEISEKDYYSDEKTKVAMRILADHIRACALIIMDGITPTNKDQGYILRQYIRRMMRVSKKLEIEDSIAQELTEITTETLSWLYPELPQKKKEIIKTINKEEEKFKKTLEKGSRAAEKIISKYVETSKDPSDKIADLAKKAYTLYQSLGYPMELFEEDFRDIEDSETIFKKFRQIFAEEHKQHQQKSRSGAEKKFKGGLADVSEQTIGYHTTTHLLHWALRKVLGTHVSQKGSNITNERLRFDFSHNEKLSVDEIKKVENLVNEKIKEELPVEFETLPKEEAIKTGALHLFGERYGDQVKVYYIGDSLETAISKEFCGGPHVSNTKDLLPVEIYKQSKIGDGLIRLYSHKKG